MQWRKQLYKEKPPGHMKASQLQKEIYYKILKIVFTLILVYANKR